MFGIVLLVFIIGAVLDDANAASVCFEAKICVHNTVERCGEDPQQGLRRFLDSCDMVEYNCLKKANYQKTNMDKCMQLPPLDK